MSVSANVAKQLRATDLIIGKYEDNKAAEVCLVDLQINRLSSPALDLNYLLFTSLNGDVRKQGLLNFLASYHAVSEKIFSCAGREMIFTRDELYDEYRNRNMFGLLMSLMVLPFVVIQSTEVPDYKSATDDDIEKIMEAQETQVLNMIDTSPLLRPRFLDMFDELIENGTMKV